MDELPAIQTYAKCVCPRLNSYGGTLKHFMRRKPCLVPALLVRMHQVRMHQIPQALRSSWFFWIHLKPRASGPIPVRLAFSALSSHTHTHTFTLTHLHKQTQLKHARKHTFLPWGFVSQNFRFCESNPHPSLQIRLFIYTKRRCLPINSVVFPE